MSKLYSAVLAGLCAGLVPVATASAQAEKRDSVYKVYREMKTMARVLNETLERLELLDGKQGLIGASPFDSKVESSYLPTVGVTLNVSVGFLIEPSDEAHRPAEAEPFDPDEDLWEKFSRSRSRHGRDSEDKDRHDEKDRRDDDRSRVWDRYSFWHVPAFDETKVERLREAVLDTIAKYGHRMEHLPAEERLIVVVDAPENHKKHFRTSGRANVFSGRDWGQSPLILDRDVTLVRPSDAPMILGMSDLDHMPWMRDHWLFSVRKGDLTEAQETETVAGKVREVRY